MKKYFKPAMEVAEIHNMNMIAQSDPNNTSDTDFGTGSGGGGSHHGDAPSWRKGF